MIKYSERYMANCFFCDKTADEPYKYYTLEVCKRCYSQLKINKLENIEPPADKYLKSFVADDERIYVDALNLYSTLFPKRLASDLLGMTLSSAGDKEMDSLFVYSMIIAARSLWIFGKTGLNPHRLDTKKIHSLHVLGNLIGVSIMGHLTNMYKDTLSLDLEDETDIIKLIREIDRSITDVLYDLKEYDDGSLHDYIMEMDHLIQASSG